MKKTIVLLTAGVLAFCLLGAIVSYDPDAVQGMAAAGCILGAIIGRATGEVGL